MKKNLLLSLMTLCCVLATAQSMKRIVTSGSYTVPVYNAYATQCQSGQDLGCAVDGSMTTLYHSSWSGGTLPDTLDFNFVDVARIDSMIYYPRPTSTGSNGNFGSIELWYSKAEAPKTFYKLSSLNLGQSANVAKIALNGANGVLNPAVVRVVVLSGYGNFASCAEMVFKTTQQPMVIEPCDPTTTIQDIKQTITAGTASSFETGTTGEGPIEYSFDGNASTIYHSSYNGGGFPITLDYTLQNADRVDYMIYTPRSSSYNGIFQSTEIWYSTSSSPTTYVKACNYSFTLVNTSTKVVFATPLLNPSHIKIVVNSGYNNYASCAEMAFYKSTTSSLSATQDVFKDNIYSGLKEGVTQTDIDNLPEGFFKTLAQCMFNGVYDTKFRVQSYEPYPTIGTTSKWMKTNTYSQLENPTGIYFDAGSTAAIFVENNYGQSISMRVFDLDANSDATYQLSNGLNKLTVSGKGLAYINYYTDSYATLQPVRIHICGGKVNGYYDINSTTSQEWKSMLTHAATTMFDIKGRKISLLYPVASLRQYSPNDAKELIQVYDSIVTIEHQMMGLYKYNKVPKNHMFAEATSKDGIWFAGGRGAHYGGGLDVVCSATTAKQSCWGIAHELGHVNQIRPGLKWVSTTEVTNNIYSAWITYLLTSSPKNKKLEVENINDAYYDGFETGTGHGKGNTIVGGRMNAYLNNGVLKGENWMCQYGPDAMNATGTEPDWQSGDKDHFVKLCPLWQLELYYQAVHPEKKDWYGDVAEKVRNTNETSLTNGQLLTNFMKNACDAVQEDLSDFFKKAGMLRTYNKYMNDYTSAQLTVTSADSIAVLNYIASKGYPKPESPVIYYLTGNSVDAYKNKLPVTGITGQGCSTMFSAVEDYQKYITVSHSVWKNVAVFETYSGSKMVRISMVGSGSADNSKTRVYYPTGSTAVYAVGWDGTRKLVYGVETALPKTIGNTTINLQPNPAKDEFCVAGLTGSALLTLTDLSGRQLLKNEIVDDEKISVQSLKQGVYMVNISTAGGAVSQKLIKK